MEGHKLRQSKSLGSFYFVNEKKALHQDKKRLLGSHTGFIGANHFDEDKDILTSISTVAKVMPKSKLSKNSKATNPNMTPMDHNDADSAKPSLPDIFRKELPDPVLPPRQNDDSLFFGAGTGSLFKFIGISISFLLGLVIIPIIQLTISIFIILPRFLCTIAIWFGNGNRNLTILPFLDSFKASGYDFYTIVYVIKGECRMEKIMQKFKSYLSSDDDFNEYPNLRKRLVKKLGFYCLEDKKEGFTLKNHLKHFEDVIQSENQDRKGLSQSKLFELLQTDFRPRVFKENSGHPQWEVLVVPKFYYDIPVDDHHGGLANYNEGNDRDHEQFYALVFRANSAVLDKQEVFKMFREEIADEDAEDSEGFESSEDFEMFKTWERFIIFIYTIFLTPWELFKRVLQGGPNSFGDASSDYEGLKDDIDNSNAVSGKVTSGLDSSSKKSSKYLLSFTRLVNFEAVKQAAENSATNVLSLLMASSGGSARNMVLSQNKPLPKSYRLTVQKETASWRVFNCILGSEMYSFPLDRLADAYFIISGSWSTRLVVEAKKNVNLMMHWIAGAFSADSGSKIYKKLNNVNITLSIWPEMGPYKVFDGNAVQDIFGWTAIAGTCADFGVTITTYGGKLRANFIADREVLGLGYKVRENVLAEEWIEEYVHMAQPCNIKPDFLFLRS